MRALVVTPDRNTPGINPRTGRPWRDYTGAFKPESDKFRALHSVATDDILRVNCTLGKPARRKQVLDFLEEKDTQFVDAVAIFCHGWKTGIQMGFDIVHIPELAKALYDVGSEEIIVTLYACSTAAGAPPKTPDAPGGDGGFADELRDGLCVESATDNRVDAHDRLGRTTQNPYLRRFEGEGSATGGQGGSWIVRPGSSLWKTWVKKIDSTDLRLRFPFMTVTEIHEELAG